MDSDFADRLVKGVDDRLGIGLKRVLPIAAAPSALVALGHVSDPEHRQVAEVVAHPTRHKRFVADCVTNVGVAGTEIAGPHRCLGLQLQRHQRVEDVPAVRGESGDFLCDAGAFKQSLAAFNVFFNNPVRVLFASEITALHQEFDRLASVACISSADRSTVAHDGLCNDAISEGDLDATVEDRPEFAGIVGWKVEFRLTERAFDVFEGNITVEDEAGSITG